MEKLKDVNGLEYKLGQVVACGRLLWNSCPTIMVGIVTKLHDETITVSFATGYKRAVNFKMPNRHLIIRDVELKHVIF